jgi:predicted Zn finger-like uncharacterized protein
MIVTCPGCAGKYRVRNEAVPQEGARMRCPKCETLFLAKPPVGDDASAPAPAAPAPAAAPAAQRSLQSFQQVAPSQLQQLPTGPQADLPQSGFAQIPAGFVVPGAGWSNQPAAPAMQPPMQPQMQPAPAPYMSAAATPRAQMQAPIPMPNMGGAQPLMAPGPITGLFPSPLSQMGQPPPQRPVQVKGGAAPAQPRDLLEELGLAPSRPAAAPILPDDGFFDAALAGQARPTPQRTPSSAGALDLDGPTNTQGYIPVSLTSQPAGTAVPAPITGGGARPAPVLSTPPSNGGGLVMPASSVSSTGKHKTVSPAPVPAARVDDVPLGKVIGSWALVTAGGAACALGLMFGAWTAGALDLDHELLPVLSGKLGIEPPYAFDGSATPALDAVVQRAQAARARGDYADEVLQWTRVLQRDGTRVLQRDARYGGADEARKQALKALGVAGKS